MLQTREEIKKQLQFIVEGAAVQRFHTRVPLRCNTDGHHSHSVAMLCYLLCGGSDAAGTPFVSSRLLMAALSHDLGEQVASDVSAPSKRLLEISERLTEFENGQLARYDLLFALTDKEQQILKWADMFDGMLFCCHEIAYGNRMMMLPYRRWRGYVQSIYPTLTPMAIEIYIAIQMIFDEYKDEPAFDCFEGVE